MERHADSMAWCFLVTSLCIVLGNGWTVNIGVIVDNDDEFARSINKSVDLAMKVVNTTKVVNMNPLKRPVDLSSSVQVSQTLCSLVSHSPIALLGPSKGSTYNVIQSYSKNLKLPYFMPAMNRGAFLDNDSYIINMYPSFIEPAIDFIKFQQWDRIFYLFDSDDALWRLQRLYQAFKTPPDDPSKQVLVDAIRIPEVRNCREILRRLDKNYKSDTKRIVVDLSSLQDYDMFLSQIIDVGMNRDGYHYLLGTLDIESMNANRWRSFKFGGVNITGFQLVNRIKLISRISGFAHLINTLGDDPLTIEVALAVDAIAALTHALKDIMNTEVVKSKVFRFRRGNLDYKISCDDPMEPLEIGEYVLNFTKKVKIDNGLSGHIAFDEYGQRANYTLYVFHLSYRTPLREVGNWTQGKGLRTSLPAVGNGTGNQDRNRTRIVTTILEGPFVQYNTRDNGEPKTEENRYEGYCIDLLREIARRVNFTYRIKLVDDNQFGKTLENGSWNGMIGELHRGEAEIALAGLTITLDRQKVVRFSKPFMNTGISIMIKKPEKQKPGVFSFMDPLSVEVWGCISVGFFAVSFILYMVGRFSPYEWQNESGGNGNAPSDTFSFVNTLWFSLGALMQQGPDIFPRSLSGRVLGSAWWFFTLIIISSYTANLAAFLTFEKLTTPIDSADDLVGQTTIHYGCGRGGSTEQFFRNSTIPTYKRMWDFMKEHQSSVFASSSKEGWRKVINGKGRYAFLMESSMNNYYNQRKPCKTMKVGRDLDQKGYGIATSKKSDLSRDINIAVLEMREYGDLFKLEQKWWYNKGECGSTDAADKGKNALNLSNVSGIFHILIGGLVLSMVISLSHLIFHSKIKPKALKGTYRVDNSREQPVQNKTHKRVTIEDPPIVTCTTSNGGEPHLITFDDNSDHAEPLNGMT